MAFSPSRKPKDFTLLVEFVLEQLETGMALEEIIKEYPESMKKNIMEAIRSAYHEEKVSFSDIKTAR